MVQAGPGREPRASRGREQLPGLTNELGLPANPEWLSDEFERLVKRTGVRRITLHEARHTAASLMEKAGAPDSIQAAWCGTR